VNTTVLVVAIVVGILLVQVLVWIPIIVWFRRRSRVVAGRLVTEIEGETVIRAPEKGVYRGATAPGYPAVKYSGLIALTRRRVVLRTLTGKAIDVPAEAITGVREAAAFKSSVVAGRKHLIIQTAAGEIGFYVPDNAGWIASISKATPRSWAHAVEHAPVVSVGPRRSPLPILAIVFASIGAALALAAGISAAVVGESISGDRYANGTVVDLVGSGRYRAVVEFATPGGATIRFTSWVSTSPPPAEVGAHVGVRYNPDNPQDAVIDQYWQIWFLPTLLGIIGAPFLLLGVSMGTVVLLQRSRSQRPR
jgi:Protein of unknown function (DUF3592)